MRLNRLHKAGQDDRHIFEAHGEMTAGIPVRPLIKPLPTGVTQDQDLGAPGLSGTARPVPSAPPLPGGPMALNHPFKPPRNQNNRPLHRKILKRARRISKRSSIRLKVKRLRLHCKAKIFTDAKLSRLSLRNWELTLLRWTR